MKKKKEEFYYKNLCSAMEYAYQAAQFLTETLKHFDKETIQEKLDAMHELEQKGDVKKHKMMKALSQAFITPIEREDLENTYLWISEFKLEKEDRLICFSDGVSQSGMGSSNMPFGWDEGVGIYIAETLSQHPGISAKELARKIVLRAERNDNYRLLDDTSCCVIYRRTPRNLLICTGPPYDEKKDRYLAEKVRDFKGKKVLCGGTTATIISRELQLPLQVSMDITDKELPPLSYMEGIDLITEGILTLSKVERLLTQGIPEKSQGPANDLVNLIQNSDKITFIVGTRINVAHQDPNLPVELEIRRNVVKKIKYLLETKFLKDVEITYL